mgnify:CR=1 FL=1
MVKIATHRPPAPTPLPPSPIPSPSLLSANAGVIGMIEQSSSPQKIGQNRKMFGFRGQETKCWGSCEWRFDQVFGWSKLSVHSSKFKKKSSLGCRKMKWQVVRIVAKFSVAKSNETRCKIKSKSSQNRWKMMNKSIKNRRNMWKISKKRPRAPQSVTKGADLNLPQLLGPSWAALGALLGYPGRAPGRPKRSQERQNSSPKPFSAYFFVFFFHVAFRIDFCTLKFATICTETLKISIFPRENTHFHKIDFFA